MPSEKKTLTVFGLIGKILEPDPNIKDANSRRQSRLITGTSLILAICNIIIGVIGIFVGFSTIAVVGLIVVGVILVAAFVLGRSENLFIGSILLVSGIILEGLFISSSIQDTSLIIIILTASIIPALVLSLTLLPILAIVGISIITLITLGALPVMARISSGTGLALFIGLAFIEGSFILIAWFKDYSENRQKDELGDLRARLEERVVERTRSTRIAADIAQEIISSSSLQELLNQTAYLTKSRFGFSHVAIYLANDAQRQIELKAAEGMDASRLLQTGKQIAYGPPSLLGWVAENKQTHLVTKLAEDPLQLEAEFLTETISDLGIPIVSRDRLLGVMDVQSAKSSVFDNETIIVLQMLASEIGTAVRNASLLEAGQGSLQESINSYQAGYKIAGAIKEDDIYSILQDLLSRTPYTTLFLISNTQGSQVKAGSNPHLPNGNHISAQFPLSIVDLEQVLASGMFVGEIGHLDSLPFELLSILREMQIIKAALIPLRRAEKVSGVLILGMQEDIPLEQSNLLPYLNLMNQIGGALDRIQEKRRIEFRISDMETISRLNNEIAKAKSHSAMAR